MPVKFRRAPVVRIYDVGDTTVLLDRHGGAHALAGPSAALARAVLSFVLSPRTRAEILAHLEQLSGGPIDDPRVVDELLALLESTGAVLRGPADAGAARSPAGARTRLVLGLSGAIAAAFAPDLVRRLQGRGFEVRAIATEAALRFVQATALEALIHHRVVSRMWPTPELPVPHVNLAQWADVALLCPATATTISRLATGDHSSLVAAVALTTRAPVVVVPSMNVDMYARPGVQRNLRQLADDGMFVVHPGSGHEVADAPAVRTVQPGPMPPHAVVVEILEAILKIEARRVSTPRTARDWDELFRRTPAAELPWHTEVLDADIQRALERVAPAGRAMRVLDLGAGLGVGARAAARLGHAVVATDISAEALARAREIAGGEAVVWLRDDVTDSRLHGSFDVILDRGCLHLLGSARMPAWAETVARLCSAGGALIVKVHDPSESERRGTTPPSAATLLALLGDRFELESDEAGSFAGPGQAPAARLFVLRRRS